MKQVLFLFAFYFFSGITLYAQDVPATDGTEVIDAEPAPKIRNISHEMGLNGTYFLKQIISLSDTTLAVSPYILTYKMMFNNVGIRAGIGGSYKREKQKDENFADNTTETNAAIAIRLGVEYQKHFHKRWTAIAGFDFLYTDASSRFVADTGFDVTTIEDRNSGYGAGPVFGIYYHLNKHLSFYTEGAFYFLSKKEETSRKFTNFPQFDDTSNTIEVTELQTYLPATLYLVFRF